MKKVLVCLLLWATAARADPFTIAVQDEKGAPVTGALVQVEGVPAKGSPAIVLPAQTSDSKGLAQVDFGRATSGQSINWRAFAYKPGLALGELDLAGGENQLVLKTPVVKSGTVLDILDRPVAGATVRIGELHIWHPSFPWSRDEFHLAGGDGGPLSKYTQTQTDRDGKRSFADVPWDAGMTLSVAAPGFVPATLQVAEDEDHRETELRREARLAGQVVEPNGTPVSGVTVRLISMESQLKTEVKTDAAGKYRVSGLAPDPYEVKADFGNRPLVAPVVFDVNVTSGDNIVPALVAQPGVVIRGTVHETDGTPVKTTVRTVHGLYEAATDADGNYALRVPPGKIALRVDGVPLMYCNVLDVQDLTAAPGTSPIVNFSLQPAPVVRGTIVDPGGNPVRAAIPISGWEGKTWGTVEVYSDVQGRFRMPLPFTGEAKIGGDPLGISHDDVVVIAPATVTFPLTGDLHLVVRPKRQLAFTAKAVDENGAPLQGVRFTVDETLPEQILGPNQFMGLERTIKITLISGADGVIRGTNLVDGATLERPAASKEGYLPPTDIHIVPAPDGFTCETLVFVRANAGFELTSGSVKSKISTKL